MQRLLVALVLLSCIAAQAAAAQFAVGFWADSNCTAGIPRVLIVNDGNCVSTAAPNPISFVIATGYGNEVLYQIGCPGTSSSGVLPLATCAPLPNTFVTVYAVNGSTFFSGAVSNDSCVTTTGGTLSILSGSCQQNDGAYYSVAALEPYGVATSLYCSSTCDQCTAGEFYGTAATELCLSLPGLSLNATIGVITPSPASDNTWIAPVAVTASVFALIVVIIGIGVGLNFYYARKG